MRDQIVRILITIALLVAVAVTKHRCGKALGGLFRVLDEKPVADAGADANGP